MISFMGDILQLFLFEPIFTAAEIQDENKSSWYWCIVFKWLLHVSQTFMHSQLIRWQFVVKIWKMATPIK